jgi:CheY-like chemotaxis protein/HPt (histidine-containing phosphotransfer) domain-containing protein
MPGMDGLQLARAIALQCGKSAPPLVMLSSSALRAGDPGASEMFAARLSKPVKHSQLFTVLIEVVHGRRAAAPAAPAQRMDPSLARRYPMRILVVEDSTINQKLAVGMLSKFGYMADLASNGLEAVEMARRNPYDLVFMDLQMPVMDGLEASRRIHSQLPAARMPRIVAMTANAMPSDRQRCIDAGMDDYIAKPILPAGVQALIEKWAPQHAPSADPDAGLLNEGVLRELAALSDPGAPSMLKALIDDWLREAPAVVGAMKQHAREGDSGELAKRAHKLGGTSASLGASGVAEVCYRIEEQVRGGELGVLPQLIDELEMRFARTRGALNKRVDA